MILDKMRWLTGAKKDLIANRGNWQDQFPLCAGKYRPGASSVASSGVAGIYGPGGPGGAMKEPGRDADEKPCQGVLPEDLQTQPGLARHFLMGIVNLTPDSFSDGGRFANPEAGLAQALRLAAEGADILDLGAESTRPGAEAVGAVTEQERLLPVVVPLCRELSAVYGDKMPAISIDTFKASTAGVCLELEHGADIINDVSGCVFEPELAEVLSQFKPAYVLGHSPARPGEMQKNPRYDDVVEDLLDYFERRLQFLTRAGLPEEHIALDPCIGFGKTLEHNLAILKAAKRFLSFGRPLFMSFSRKAMFRELLAVPADDIDKLDTATHVALGILASQNGDGVIIYRVHQVRGAAVALQLAAHLQRT